MKAPPVSISCKGLTLRFPVYGVDAKSLVVPEAGHLAHRAAYESNLRAYSSGGPSGVQAWALYGAEAFSAGAEASPLRG